MLWIALELPSLPLQLAERGCASPSPLLIAEGPEQRPRVACANAAARSAGIREGQAVASAKALALELKVLARDPSAEAAALEGLAGWAAQFTPAVSIDGQGIVMEVGSTLRLFGGHAKLTAAVVQGVRELGYQTALGVAPTPLAARLFARAEAQGIRVRACVNPADLPARLADLPLFLLEWPERTLALLADLGVLRVKDALALPREGLARRFGPEVVATLDRLLGQAPDPRLPYVPPAVFHVALELPSEVESTEALLFPLRRLLNQMEGFLRGRGAGVQQLALTLHPVRGKSTRIDFDFASPERECGFILALAREKLGRTQLAAPTLTLELRAEALMPFQLRSSTWLPGRDEAAIGREHLLQKLSARIGKERVFGVAIADDHRPERQIVPQEKRGRSHFSAANQKMTPTPFFGRRPAWLLHRPQKLIAEQGAPIYQGKLAFIAGPERIEAGWWDGEPIGRDYFVATNPAGETFWVYRDHRDTSAWYLHGVFA